MPPVNEWTNKAVLYVASAIGTVILSTTMALLGKGLTAYADAKYQQRVDSLDFWIDYYDRRAYEIDEIFVTVDDLDHITAKRLGMDKAYYESTRAKLLRQRADLRE